MRRTRLFRTFASLLSIWFAICMVEPMQLHTCVMHGGLAIDVSAPAGPMHTVAMAGGFPRHVHGGIASNLAMAGHSHHDHRTDGQARQCTCLGDCNAGRNLVGLASATTPLISVQAENQRAAFGYVSPSLVSPHFFLPFSNGPPSASSRA